MFQVSSFKFQEQGVTLIEVIVVIFVVALFSVILISDFPKIQRQFALSRAAYRLSQDLRKTQDLALSGVKTQDSQGNLISAKGYGIYVNISNQPARDYIIYADVDNNQKYDGDLFYPLCIWQINPTSDCVIEIIDVSQQNQALYIKQIDNITSAYATSINFSPPGPATEIENLSPGVNSVGIVLGLDNDISTTRTVWANTSGLINIQ